MNDFITIKTFTYPHEAEIVGGMLESEGIEYNIKDALTTQINPLYSNALGGAKLQVRQSDVEAALAILKETGYLKNGEVRFDILRDFESVTSAIPVLNKLRVEFRFLTVVATVTIIVLTAIYFITVPGFSERLINGNWCVDCLYFEGKKYFPKTTGLRIIMDDQCSEAMDMRKNGDIILPGFHSSNVYGHWELTGRTVRISSVDTFQNVFNGDYKATIEGNQLILRSQATSIFCIGDE